ncbi:uncharacterized protein CTRU02_211374 [Colletotrichum truncatum]|uniref:Uncharacterized protein n=1 Tax=Colletotrichum truncatum TaxID=5467 RepID=A0ACC3YRQ8_COLTU
MHHYADHIAVLLQPIEHPQNPYRQLYIPAALEAASGMSPMKQTNKQSVQSVILHSLLSSSAFHLWNCLPSQTSYHKIGSQHRQQALFLLQSTIRFEMTTTDYKMLMVAMLSLVTIDQFMSGCEADFAIHLQGTQQLRNRRRKWRHISRETRQLNEISDFLHLLARTMAFSSSPRPWPSVNTQDTEGFVASGIESDCCFGYMYGITTVTATNIFETCRLAEYLSWYKEYQEPIPDGLLEACESLGDRLCCWSFQAESSRHISDDEDAFEIFRHHSNAWHLAALTYYHRRIQRCCSHDHDQVIAKIAEHMHAVEDIKERSASNAAKRMAPIMWPAFVASCEATFHDTWTLWWQRVQSYHIANYQRLWEVIQQIWQKQEIMSQPAASDFDWIEAFKDLEITLLPI